MLRMYRKYEFEFRFESTVIRDYRLHTKGIYLWSLRIPRQGPKMENPQELFSISFQSLWEFQASLPQETLANWNIVKRGEHALREQWSNNQWKNKCATSTPGKDRRQEMLSFISWWIMSCVWWLEEFHCNKSKEDWLLETFCDNPQGVLEQRSSRNR